MISSLFGVLMRLLMSKTNTVMLPIADITIKILCSQEEEETVVKTSIREVLCACIKPVYDNRQLMSRIEDHVVWKGDV